MITQSKTSFKNLMNSLVCLVYLHMHKKLNNRNNNKKKHCPKRGWNPKNGFWKEYLPCVNITLESDVYKLNHYRFTLRTITIKSMKCYVMLLCFRYILIQRCYLIFMRRYPFQCLSKVEDQYCMSLLHKGIQSLTGLTCLLTLNGTLFWEGLNYQYLDCISPSVYIYIYMYRSHLAKHLYKLTPFRF